jgi:hypothetical protein
MKMNETDLQSCIDACNACADACNHCTSMCLQEPDVTPMAGCIRRNIDCAQLCRTAAALMARGSDHAKSMCQVCVEACRACGDECGKHAMDHCQQCAAACRRCAEACAQMA